MTVKELTGYLNSLPDEMEVVIKTFGNDDADLPDTFDDIANFEIEKVKGKDTFTLATY